MHPTPTQGAPAPRPGVFARQPSHGPDPSRDALLEALRNDETVLLVTTDAAGRVRAIVRRPTPDSDVAVLVVPELEP